MLSPDHDFESYKGKLSAETLRDIEGIDPAEFGFGRKECCTPITSALRTTMKLGEHIFLTTPMHFKEWDSKTSNVAGYTFIQKKAKEELPNATVTVAQTAEGTDAGLIRFVADAKTGAVTATEYHTSVGDLTEMPWNTRGALATDRSAEYFVFVCSHTARDKRCGFCGAVLADLLRAEIESRRETLPATVTVLPCSHVGGHIYAGNVIVYSRFGGVGLGRLAPSNVADIVEMIRRDNGVIPSALEDHIRGTMGAVKTESESATRMCTMM